MDVGLGESVLRLVFAMLLGGLIGWDREARGKAAGLRTHMMVGLGAAGFTLAAMEISAVYVPLGATADPLRALGGVVGGIGFLGAGAIFRSGSDVKGLTTAAGLWVVGAAGVACGAGLWILSSVIVGLVATVLIGVGSFEHRYLKRRRNESDD
jgi:putative Mg2+ transporter-C (MgtC) family protein